MPLARRKLKQLQAQLTLAPNQVSFEHLTIREYYDIYKEDFLSEVGSQSWSGKQRMHIEAFILPPFGNVYLDQVSLYNVEAWYKKLCRKHPRKYANHIVRTFKCMLKRAEGKYIQNSPIRELKLLTPEKKIPDTLTMAQVKKIVKKLDGRDKLFFVLGITTGMRIGEIQHLQWKDINIETGVLFVRTKPERRIKDAEDRAIPLAKDCVDILRVHYQDKDPATLVFPANHGGVFSTIGEYAIAVFDKADIRKGSANLLRHTFASFFLSQGGNLAELQHIMGHSSITVTEQSYAAFLPPDISTIHNIDFGVA